MIKNGDNVVLKFSTIWDGELCRYNGKAYIYPSMEKAIQYCHPDHEVLVEYTPVKRGKWVKNTDINVWGEGSDTIFCSCCGQGINVECIPWFRFCSNCGADMRTE